MKKIIPIRLKASDRRFNCDSRRTRLAFDSLLSVNPANIPTPPRISVRLVRLLTTALRKTSSPGAPSRNTKKTNIKFPKPEKYGITKVPKTVPFTPLPEAISSLQTINNEAATNRKPITEGVQLPAEVSICFKIVSTLV